MRCQCLLLTKLCATTLILVYILGSGVEANLGMRAVMLALVCLLLAWQHLAALQTLPDLNLIALIACAQVRFEEAAL